MFTLTIIMSFIASDFARQKVDILSFLCCQPFQSIKAWPKNNGKERFKVPAKLMV